MAKRSPVLAILCLLASLLVPSLSSASTAAAPMPRARCFALTVADSARASSAFASRAAFEAAGASRTAAKIAGVVASIAGPGKLKSAVKLSWGLARQGGKRAAATAVGGAAASGGLNGRRLWGPADTLDDHFRRHGADFGAKNADDYAQQASDVLGRSQAGGLPTKIGPDGTIRVYDPASNTFGSFNPDGTTKTFFKPSAGQGCWDRQPGSAPWTPN